MPIRSRTLRNKHNKQVGWYRNTWDRHHLSCAFGLDTRNSSFRKGEPGCRFRRASRIVSRVGVSRSDLVCSMIKISFKNVSQKNVSITIFIVGVENVDLIPIRDARGNRTLDFRLSDDIVIRMVGGVDSAVHLASYRGQGVNANIGTGNFNGVNVVYGRVPPCKIKRFPRGQTPARIPIRGARGVRTLEYQLSDDRIHPKAGVSIPSCTADRVGGGCLYECPGVFCACFAA